MNDEIAAPKRDDHYPDRSLDCRFALEPAFQYLAERAQAAGWSEDDVSTALLELAHHHNQRDHRQSEDKARHRGCGSFGELTTVGPGSPHDLRFPNARLSEAAACFCSKFRSDFNVSIEVDTAMQPLTTASVRCCVRQWARKKAGPEASPENRHT